MPGLPPDHLRKISCVRTELIREKIKHINHILFNFVITQSKYYLGKIMSKLKGKVEVAGIMGPIWFIGWLFTIGFLKLTFWKGFLALLFWPYFLGVKLAM